MKHPSDLMTGFALFAVVLLSGCAGTEKRQAAMGESADRAFVETAIRTVMAQREFARIAQEKTTNSVVLEFANAIATDYIRNAVQLSRAALHFKMLMPGELLPEDIILRRQLLRLTSSDFDQRYMQIALSRHQQLIELYSYQAERGFTPAIVNYAQQSLIGLRSNYRLAHETVQEIGSKSVGMVR